MRVLVSVDLEGVAGVADPEDISPGTAEWQRSRSLMTDEANAAVRGALGVDPTAEVVVCDAHARCRNLLPDRLDPRALLVRGAPREGDMLTGLRPGDLVCMIGYHARAGASGAVLAHTVSGRTIRSVRIDGLELGELGLGAALAASAGAAPVLVSGDDVLAIEAAGVVPGITCVPVKRSIGARAVESLHPSVACARIEEGVALAVERAADVRPPSFGATVTLEVDLLRPHMTERALLVPGVERLDGTTLRIGGVGLPVAIGLIGLFADLAGID